jgi:hypothetical protein
MQGAKSQSCDASTKHRTFTDGVGTIQGEEEAGKTSTLGYGNSAFHVEGLKDGNVVDGCEYILRAESLGGADSRHDLFCEGTPFGNVFELDPA